MPIQSLFKNGLLPTNSQVITVPANVKLRVVQVGDTVGNTGIEETILEGDNNKVLGWYVQFFMHNYNTSSTTGDFYVRNITLGEDIVREEVTATSEGSVTRVYQIDDIKKMTGLIYFKYGGNLTTDSSKFSHSVLLIQVWRVEERVF